VERRWCTEAAGAAGYAGGPAFASLGRMPFKFNAYRRHRIPRTHYRVRNWPVYEAGLKRRGDLMLWIDEAAIAGWQAPRRTTPGERPRSEGDSRAIPTWPSSWS
jgi:hypothetical protein